MCVLTWTAKSPQENKCLSKLSFLQHFSVFPNMIDTFRDPIVYYIRSSNIFFLTFSIIAFCAKVEDWIFKSPFYIISKPERGRFTIALTSSQAVTTTSNHLKHFVLLVLVQKFMHISACYEMDAICYNTEILNNLPPCLINSRVSF